MFVLFPFRGYSIIYTDANLVIVDAKAQIRAQLNSEQKRKAGKTTNGGKKQPLVKAGEGFLSTLNSA